MRKFVIIALLTFGVVCSFREKQHPTPYTFPPLFHFPPMPSAAHNVVTREGALLGRYLFYDPALSRDSTISCASCHRQSSAFSDGPNAFSKGINGTSQSRNTLPLFNLAWYPRLFWDGRAAGIEEHVSHPLAAAGEMNISWAEAVKRLGNSRRYGVLFRNAFGYMQIDSTHIVKAIAQFERTLISNNSKYDSALRGEAIFSEEEFRGFNLVNDMTRGDCLHCHTTDADALGTSAEFSNNGLATGMAPGDFSDKGLGSFTGKLEDIGKFKIPSLRNLLFTAPYMHDGRFKNLEDVLDFYSDGVHPCLNVDPRMATSQRGGARLSEEEKHAILAFLYTLSDSSFIRNVDFSDPLLEINRKNEADLLLRR